MKLLSNCPKSFLSKPPKFSFFPKFSSILALSPKLAPFLMYWNGGTTLLEGGGGRKSIVSIPGKRKSSRNVSKSSNTGFDFLRRAPFTFTGNSSSSETGSGPGPNVGALVGRCRAVTWRNRGGCLGPASFRKIVIATRADMVAKPAQAAQSHHRPEIPRFSSRCIARLSRTAAAGLGPPTARRAEDSRSGRIPVNGRFKKLTGRRRAVAKRTMFRKRLEFA
ncbi:Hypothetical protein NTJ_16259 [Nesidiocoris tenuis]|uniref:Uncharacterized protein n=1 Tax=Nesidiocoris tenuis TaxID=355587 RepID=A0ABN7BIJ8_9HEMI|nr:Hypothetical protein NTJ_16259 [Nesidiocoris tenuis]